MSYSLQSTTSLSSLGDAIRSKTGDSASMTVEEMITAVNSIVTGGGGSSSSGWIKRKEFYETTQSSSATEIIYNSYLDIDTELEEHKEWIFTFTTCRYNHNAAHYSHSPRYVYFLYCDGSTVWSYGYSTGAKDISTVSGNNSPFNYGSDSYIIKFETYIDNTTHTRIIRINNNTSMGTAPNIWNEDINLGEGGYMQSNPTRYVWGNLFYLSENYNEIPPINVHNLVSANENGGNSALYDALFDRLTFVPTSGNMNNFMNNAKNHPMTSVDWRNKVIDLSSTPNSLDSYNMERSFYGCSIKYLPKIIIPANTAFNIRNINSLFGSSDLVEMRSDFFPAGTGMDTTRASGVVRGSQFNYCYRLRSIPDDFLAAPYYLFDNAFYNANGSNMNYYRYNCCYVLKKVLGVAYPSAPTTKITANHFQYTFNECICLHRVTFYKPNGSVGTMNATNQTVDLSKCGYWRLGGGYDVTTYLNQYLEPGDSLILINSAATATIANVKNENSYATEVQYSTYTRKSAVETINSLPDTTGAGGGNTIMFASGAGSAYGTAYDMSELTAAEIAVATAKGWTVTLV